MSSGSISALLARFKETSSSSRLDEEVKELVFVDFTVCLLLVFGHIFSKQTF